MKRFLIFVVVVFMFVLVSCQEEEGPFKVNYHANAQGTIGFVTDDTPYESGDEATVLENHFTRSGYVFQYWNTTPTDTGKKYNPGDKIPITNMTVNLYAIWQSN